MRGLITEPPGYGPQSNDTTYQRLFSYTLPNKNKTHKFTNDYVSLQTDNIYLNSPVQEKQKLRSNKQQESHFKLWDDNPSIDQKARKHHYNKTNFELNDYKQHQPEQPKPNKFNKGTSQNVQAALGEEQVLRDKISKKSQSTQESYVNNVKKLFDSFYQPEEIKKRPEYPNDQGNDRIMQMNGASIDALENGKASLKEDLGQYFAMQGGARKIKERTPVLAAQADNIASLKIHQEQ